MSPVEISEALDILGSFAKVVDGLGIPGIVALMLAGPLLMLCALYIIEYRRNQSTTAMVNSIRVDFQQSLEAYRADTCATVKELGANQSRTDQYYRDNVELVKGYQMVTRNLQDVVVTNTRATERLITMLEERRKHHE